MAAKSQRTGSASQASDSISGFLKDLDLSESLTEKLGDMISETSVASEFFPDNQEMSTGSSKRETITIISLDIGNYRPEEITWSVEEDHVTVFGKRCQGIRNGVEGKKFTRKITIPDGVDPNEITGRFSAGDGVFILEGVKFSSSGRRTTKIAYFDDLTATITCDFGQRVKPQDLGLNYSSAGPTHKLERKISLFGDT